MKLKIKSREDIIIKIKDIIKTIDTINISLTTEEIIIKILGPKIIKNNAQTICEISYCNDCSCMYLSDICK